MDIGTFGWTVVGVAISVVLPVLTHFINAQFNPKMSVGGALIMPLLKKYGALFIFSTVVALIAQAVYQSQHPGNMSWYAALLVGYTAEATIEKLRPATA